MEDTARRFEGRHVVVTGAGSGIGRAVALRLADEGASISMLGRREDALGDTERLIRARGDATLFSLAVDIRDRRAVDQGFARAASELGPIQALIANSGVGGANQPGATDRFDEIIQTNLIGTYSCLRAAERHLASGPLPRHLIVVASILARIGVAGYTGYCASKSALLGLVRALACEVAPANVQVNAVLPGWVNTSMAREGLEGMAREMNVSVEDARATAMQAVPLRRMSEPEDVAGLVAWLISNDARGITGQGVDMNGGAFMN